MSESNVQHAPDSTGKKVRTIALDIPQDDGSITTVHMQVMGIRDENGLSVVFQDSLLAGIYQEMRLLRQGMFKQQGLAFDVPSAYPSVIDFS